jgi:phospholipid/cholesterol/gamma-HCH transport system substrate-binding protein
VTLRENLVEALIGAVVLLIGGWFVWYAYTHTEAGMGGGYPLVAKFPSTTGIAVGSDVRISGVKVGTVSSQGLDPQTFQAQLTFTVRDDIQLPIDTIAKIASEGLLGGAYLDLSPGGSDELLKAGDQIEQTQGSVDLMGLIGQAIYSVGGRGSEGDSAPAAQPSP